MTFFSRVITDDNVRGEILPFVNFSDLKHRDRDMIVEILKFWSESTMTAEEMQTLWYINTYLVRFVG